MIHILLMVKLKLNRHVQFILIYIIPDGVVERTNMRCGRARHTQTDASMESTVVVDDNKR